MSESFYEKQNEERRKFPRNKAQCPLNYFTRTTGHWNDAYLQNYSRGGICFICNESLQQDTKITIQITEEAHKEVPAMAVSAVVVRCEEKDGRQYKVACKFTREIQGNVTKVSRYGNRYS